MTDSPDKTPKQRRAKKTGKPAGLAETPQPDLSGTPLTGSVSDWVLQLEREAETADRDAEMSRIRSQAGKHRVKVQQKARKQQEARSAEDIPGGGANKVSEERTATAPSRSRAKGAGVSGKSSASKQTTTIKSSRGTFIGASNKPRARAAGGLSPIAGLDVSLEEAEASSLNIDGVTATVAALSSLIESGDPNPVSYTHLRAHETDSYL